MPDESRYVPSRLDFSYVLFYLLVLGFGVWSDQPPADMVCEAVDLALR